jgi:uncharacterized DUF497 family protein
MGITYDPDKRARTLEERGLDFEDAPLVFAGLTVGVEDTRKDYGEVRMICYGKLEVAWSLSATPRVARTVISSA